MIKQFFRTTKQKYGDGILSIAANFIQKGAFLIVALLLARLFGPKLFGEYAFLRQAFDVLIVFILFGGDKSLIYFSAINKSDGLIKLISVIKFATLIIILLFIISVFLREQLLVDYNFSYNLLFLLIFALAILLNIIIIFIEGYFIGIKSLKTYFKSVIISAIFYLPLSYFLGYKYGIMGVFVALFLHFSLQIFYIY
jgi:O-antigen/teichoic acid export membrane protein